MTIVPARPASTVVLLRPSPARFEVFLVKRHDNVAFMGGAHVFPGGRVDRDDRIEAPERICDGVVQAVARLPDLDPTDAVAHYIAAIRELFEEAGVLLAHPVDPPHLAARRHEVAERTLSLSSLATREGFRFVLDALVPFAHWVTPEIEIKRFDTRFFVAPVPEGQSAEHDQHETTHGEWVDPNVAIERCRRDEIALPPPTWTTLRMLSKLTSVDDVMAWARARRVVRVQPGFIKTETEAMLTLPGDPTFPAMEGFEVPEETRFILANGRWRATR